MNQLRIRDRWRYGEHTASPRLVDCFLVVDSHFNRKWTPNLIGKAFLSPPSYCGVIKMGLAVEQDAEGDLP